MHTVSCIEDDGNELDVPRARIVDVLVDEIPLPADSVSDALGLGTHHAFAVGFGANHENIAARPNLAVHPPWPALRRRVLVLVEHTYPRGCALLRHVLDYLGCN